MDVMDEHHARLAQEPPERREEGDPVDDLEHDVGVAADPAEHRPRSAREDGHSRAHAVYDQPVGELLDLRGPRIAARDDGDAVAPGDPPGHLAEEIRARPAALGVGPVAVGQDEDVQGPATRHTRCRRYRTLRGVDPPVEALLWRGMTAR